MNDMNNLIPLEREGGIEPPLPTTAEAAPVARVYDYTCISFDLNRTV